MKTMGLPLLGCHWLFGLLELSSAPDAGRLVMTRCRCAPMRGVLQRCIRPFGKSRRKLEEQQQNAKAALPRKP